MKKKNLRLRIDALEEKCAEQADMISIQCIEYRQHKEQIEFLEKEREILLTAFEKMSDAVNPAYDAMVQLKKNWEGRQK